MRHRIAEAIAARKASTAALQALTATVNRADPLAAVRQDGCPLCGAPAARPCQSAPAADHLARWLAAYTASRVTRDQVTAEIVRLVIVTKWCLVPERAA